MTAGEALRLLDIAQTFDDAAAAMLTHRRDDVHTAMAGAFAACAWRLRHHVTDTVEVTA